MAAITSCRRQQVSSTNSTSKKNQQSNLSLKESGNFGLVFMNYTTTTTTVRNSNDIVDVHAQNTWSVIPTSSNDGEITHYLNLLNQR